MTVPELVKTPPATASILNRETAHGVRSLLANDHFRLHDASGATSGAARSDQSPQLPHCASAAPAAVPHGTGSRICRVDRVTGAVPMRATLEKVASAVLRVLSDEAAYVTGAVPDVSGERCGIACRVRSTVTARRGLVVSDVSALACRCWPYRCGRACRSGHACPPGDRWPRDV